MTEPRYVTIYCAQKAVKDEAHALAGHLEAVGRCLAERVDGRWQCCCCGKSVKVAA